MNVNPTTHMHSLHTIIINTSMEYWILLSTRGELEIDEPGWAHNALVYTNASWTGLCC